VVGTSGVTLLATPTLVIACNTSVLHGFVLSSLLLGDVSVHYLGCLWRAGQNASQCEANSVGATGGLILTNTLHGILGLVLPSKAIGILLLPVSGKVITTLARATKEGAECAGESTVAGNFAGVVEPIGSSQTTGKLAIALTGGKQNITDIDLTHGLGLAAPKLTFAGETAALEQVASLTYAVPTEVT
jgi:hypothetical protein